MEVMKQLRQRAIRDLVDQRPIRTQQELAAALRERGFRTTQATISRDVAELGLDQGRPRRDRGLRAAAAPHRGRDVRRGPAAQAAGATCRSRSARRACCSSCARCRARRMRSRPRLDRARWPEVAGSIAGDDTLFVAFPDRGSLQRIKRRLVRLTEAWPGLSGDGQADRARRDVSRARICRFDTAPTPRLPFAPGRNFRRAATAAGRLEFFPLS